MDRILVMIKSIKKILDWNFEYKNNESRNWLIKEKKKGNERKKRKIIFVWKSFLDSSIVSGIVKKNF